MTIINYRALEVDPDHEGTLDNLKNLEAAKEQKRDYSSLRFRPPPQISNAASTIPKKKKEKKHFCSGNGCTKDNASFLCPKCNEKGISTFFCSQECFKLNYSTHKTIHKK